MLYAYPIKINDLADLIEKLIEDIEQHSIKIKEGLKSAAENGHFPGRPSRFDDEFIRKLKQRILAGEKPKDLQREFDIKSSTFYHILTKETGYQCDHDYKEAMFQKKVGRPKTKNQRRHQQSEYKQNNKKIILEKAREYRHKNKEKIAQYQVEYCKTNKEKRAANARKHYYSKKMQAAKVTDSTPVVK